MVIQTTIVFSRFASLALGLGLVSKIDFYNPVSILAFGIQFASLMLTLNDLTKLMLTRGKMMIRNNVYVWFGQGLMADWIQMTGKLGGNKVYPTV